MWANRLAHRGRPLRDSRIANQRGGAALRWSAWLDLPSELLQRAKEVMKLSLRVSIGPLSCERVDVVKATKKSQIVRCIIREGLI